MKNMVLSLLGVTFISSLSVGIVNKITEQPIREAQEAATQMALQKVVPAFRKSGVTSVDVDGFALDVYTTRSAKNEVVGYAVKSQTKDGYSGAITMMVGIAANGNLYDVSILSHSETPGLGSKMCDVDNSLIRSIKGRNIDSLDLRVSKDGGDIDALSGATITSRAYGNAISRAYRAVQIVKGSGASSAADSDDEQQTKEQAAALAQKQRMEQMMKQVKANQAKGATVQRYNVVVNPGNDAWIVDSALVRKIMRQYSFERFDWLIQKAEQEYRSDKEIKRRSAQLAAVAAQRVKEREAQKQREAAERAAQQQQQVQ